MSDMKLKTTLRVQATLVLESGLHIGAGKDAIEIGGIDLPVVKNPFSREPYIPGSSIKGKLRSLLEWALEKIEPNGDVWGNNRQRHEKGEYHATDPILRAFGVSTGQKWEGGPTRLIVRDSPLQRAWAERVIAQGLPLTEEKTEVTIDRIQGKAKDNVGTRRIERVPAGARFELEMVFKVLDVDDDDGRCDLDAFNRVLEGLKLLEHDALGGHGSRGYGRVRIQDLRVEGQSVQKDFDAIHQIGHQTPNSIWKARQQ